MPRQNGVYVEPAGTKGTPNTTIQSAPYNAFVDDLVADANSARPVSAGGTGATSASGARTALGLTIGTNVQAYDAVLQSISALQTSASGDQIFYTTGTDVAALATITGFGRSLIDDVDAAGARATLGLGTLATGSSVNNGNWSGDDLDVTNGGTGASTAAAARSNLGAAAASISITAGTGLSGGGDLSADRSLEVSFGNAAGTAAQGNDSRIVNAVPNARTVTAGNGLTGGGALSGNVSIAMGTPGTLTSGTANAASSTSHTHAVDEDSIVSVGMAALGVGAIGTYALLRVDSGGGMNPGNTRSGASLSYSTPTGTVAGNTIGGTWRCMGNINDSGTGSGSVSVFLRIA